MESWRWWKRTAMIGGLTHQGLHDGFNFRKVAD